MQTLNAWECWTPREARDHVRGSEEQVVTTLACFIHAEKLPSLPEELQQLLVLEAFAVNRVCERGQKHGLYRSWYKTGKLKCECTYERDQRHGLCRSWYKSGKPLDECTYERGHLHGRYRSWYDNGETWDEFTYEQGQRHGRDRLWNDKGDLLRDCTYEHGQLVQNP